MKAIIIETEQAKGWLETIWLGSLKNDYLAAMSAVVIAAILQFALASGAKDTSVHSGYLIGALLAYRGLLQVGWHYNLRGVRRGSRLLMLSFCLSFYTYGGEHIIADYLEKILDLLGLFILFVDLIAMQFQVSRWLVWSLVSLKIGSTFLLHLGLISQLVSDSLSAVCYLLIAWLFWELRMKLIVSKAPILVV